MKHFFNKRNLTWPESRWIDILKKRFIFTESLKPEKIYFLCDAPYIAPNIAERDRKSILSFKALDVPKICVKSTLKNFENSQFFVPILK